jgi:phosphoribosylglycinamide formyltransferase 2
VILATEDSTEYPRYKGIGESLRQPKTDLRIFGKPVTRKYRRMGVGLAYGPVDSLTDELRKRAAEVARSVVVNP